ncbi:MAG: hypothetical protein HKL90_16850 [Elusimicrobia bacterium]|nr:hypothetical protein [Elusimicrobiota bacterium]
MEQNSLFPEPAAICTKVLQRRRDFEALFAGFVKLKAVSYVVSADLLLEFFERGFVEVEAVVGENMSEHYRRELEQKGTDVALRLAERVSAGTLKIYVPERTIHTKLYMLERPGLRRVIATSANLTETAREASRQINYAWYADLPEGHAWLDVVEKDYQIHKQRCALFMGDLAELLGRRGEQDAREIVESWLKSSPHAGSETETRRLLQEISRRSVAVDAAAAEPVFTMKLPDAPAARREAERILSPLNAATANGEIRINAPGYLRYVQATQGVPVLRVDRELRQVRLGIDGETRVVNEPPADAAAVDRALEHIESYLRTVDAAQSPDPRFAKTSMFEALLYMLASPFADDFMRLKRERYGAIDSRGPRFLYIYGPSQNGKSTFLRFALKLLVERSLEPLNGGDFSKRKIVGAASVGTTFPLVFDDLVLAQRYGLFEEVLKSYWEVWWNQDGVSPQIILSSNTYSLRDWAKSRVKRLDFDVQFAPDGAGKENLAGIFREENRLFRWFSQLYLENLDQMKSPSDDELGVARAVMQELYRRAGRALPEYFPSRPIEQLYDPGRRDWKDLLERLKKARIDWDRDRASIHFAEDLQHFEIKAYENALPAAVKHRRRGRALIVESPVEFRAWLDGGRTQSGRWWNRLKPW